MPKRKAVQDPKVDDSDLSPPPNDLKDGATALADANAELETEASPAKRRKTAKSTVNSETTTNGTVDPTQRVTRTRKVKSEPQEDEAASSSEEISKPTPKKRLGKAKVVKEEGAEEEDVVTKPLLNGRARKKPEVNGEKARQEEEDGIVKPSPKGRARKKPEVKEEAKEEDNDGKATEKPVKKKRKTKEEKEAEAMPLAARTVGHKLFVGAHVSSAGGIQNAPLNSVHIGANAFALFLKSQRKWVNPPILSEAAQGFHDNCQHHSYSQNEHVVPHGSYLVNLAHTDPARTTQAYDSFVDDLKRCEKLGIKLYNFHPGVANSTNGDKAKAIAHLASNINRALKETSTVRILCENMAAGGNVLGSSFEDLRDIIALVDDKDRVGVCFDTCHAFAGGYDLRTPEAFKATMDEFESIVGVKYLRALHINDSKAPFSSHRDLHANIGTGFLGLRAFHNIVNEPRFAGLPLILETPIEMRDADGQLVKDEKGKVKEDKNIWATEIKMLESLTTMDVESEEFLKLEADLARKGKPERDRLWEQIEKKKEKEAAKGAKKGKAKSKKAKDEDEESELSDVKSERD
jgi:AP endonuclease-1